MKKYSNKALNPFLILFSALFLYGCVANKDNALDRKFQNLTARYNYIYNSNVLLTEYNEGLLQSFQDNYEKVLPVYLDPEPQVNLVLTTGTPNKILDEVIRKGQTIINDKSFSNYIDDSYMLMGRSYYLKGNYFMASEYFDYVAKTYSENLKVYILAMNWKARCQMQLNNMVVADKILDTMLRAEDILKKDIAQPLATTAQMRIYQKRYKEAILLLETAIRVADEKQLRIRWQYILAQLQELDDDLQNAFINYTKVENSNAPFEMYFHANLQRIKVRALISGNKADQDKALLSLIKDDKNEDFIDQIYYQIGELFSKEGKFLKAEENYEKSIQNSTKNQTQKALSYLRVADINFKELKNYLKAKVYYDSTVITLPKTFPDYDLIVKKANNLKYLTDRYSVVSKEDTAQFIAKLPDNERGAKIRSYLTPKAVYVGNAKPTQQTSGVKQPIKNQPASVLESQEDDLIMPTNVAGSTFYFNNNAAISSGFGDFKKRWGNRQLEDNWRQSLRTSEQETNQITNNDVLATATTPTKATDTLVKQDQLVLEKNYLDSLPISPSQLAASDQKIKDALFQIANFYQQELNDKNEANKTYQELLRRYPENNHLAAIYYSLYLNNKGVDENKSNTYRQLVLTKYPESNFAKTILDPSFSAKQSEMENITNNNYNVTFEAYANKNYPSVIKQVNDNVSAFPDNDLAPQYAYLKAIAVGRTSKVAPLLSEFNAITSLYPNDKIVTPLVKDHLKYIDANMEEFKQRPVALVDFDNNEPRFVSQVKAIDVPTRALNRDINAAIEVKTVEEVVKPKEKIEEVKAIEKITDTTKLVEVKKPEEAVKPVEVIKIPTIFSTEKSAEYYYVIDVADATLTLSSSRFGIGQFNRGNFPSNDLIHKLIERNNDQLIYVTSFIDLSDAKLYESSINSQLKNIMKIPADLYRSFIVSKENFEKLTTRDRIDEYLIFFKENYK